MYTNVIDAIIKFKILNSVIYFIFNVPGTIGLTYLPYIMHTFYHESQESGEWEPGGQERAQAP